MPQWPRLRCSVKDKSTNPLAFVYFLKCHHLPRSFANTQTGTCSRMGGANFMNPCIISPVLQPCSPVPQGSLQSPDFDGKLFIHSFLCCTLQCVPTVFPHWMAAFSLYMHVKLNVPRIKDCFSSSVAVSWLWESTVIAAKDGGRVTMVYTLKARGRCHSQP